MTGPEVIDIIAKMDAFHKESSRDLIIFMSAFFGIFGLVWPLLIGFLFSIKFKKNEKILEEKLQLQISKDMESAIKKSNISIINKFNELKVGINRNANRHDDSLLSQVLHLQGMVEKNNQDYAQSLYSFIDAAIQGLASGDEKNFQAQLDSICSSYGLLKNHDDFLFCESIYTRLMKPLSQVNRNNKHLNKIKELVASHDKAKKRLAEN